jgi:hypothetical protein
VAAHLLLGIGQGLPLLDQAKLCCRRSRCVLRRLKLMEGLGYIAYCEKAGAENAGLIG